MVIDECYVLLIISIALYLRTSNTSGSSPIMQTTTNYITITTWYRIKVTNSIIGTKTMYIKGGNFGKEYVLVNLTGGIGTNPVLDNTYKINNLSVIDASAGDRIGKILHYSNVR